MALKLESERRALNDFNRILGHSTMGTSTATYVCVYIQAPKIRRVALRCRPQQVDKKTRFTNFNLT